MSCPGGSLARAAAVTLLCLSACGGSGSSRAADDPESAPRCTADAECGTGSFCERPDGACGSSTGECRLRPEICTMDWNPVCGCEGKTYSNDCNRRSAGASKDYRGECGSG